ncbi:thiolase family protein [Alicyclobacillus cycloheptanicus]|uniref:acetyl-CoA C-acyltransferase n=1 Tax=Alicyclobacillus cycloheptanicus TaxID=1457 RepID=A0ABT9XHC7_9BACL|nr:thiolase family protein [Alicyclobacillus cycloheptanicus]MDQ0189713.1 3-oxoadipyl-CoA thiolase [Alicyclobacillus cycloheptanicus]WDM01925.1 thiolase family protein [Alicyclobacillus cycloheptanicus]
MREAVIVDVVRTPIGKHRGALSAVRPDDLAALVIRTLVERNQLDAGLIEDVYLGCANQAGEDNRNVARMAALLAELPETVAGVTVNRLCASGLEAINQAARAILVGEGDVFIAGGTESMTRAPLVLPKPEESYVRGNQTMYDTTLGWRMVNPKLAQLHYPYSMGETAENVAERYGITRQAQDEFAKESQDRAIAAIDKGYMKDEIVPVEVPAGRKGETVVVDTDEHPRRGVTLDQLAKLRPAFREGGTVTAGNSSGINDGAAAVLIMSRDKAQALGLEPKLRYVASAAAGVDPAYMGIGPVPATQKALRRAGIGIGDLDTIELNEAFAAQSLAVIQELGLNRDRVNPNGGAIAFGHPLGCSGARLVATLTHQLARTGGRYGLTTLCVGVGQGVATVWENLRA